MEKFVPEAEKVHFTGCSAEADTELMSFDKALQRCGIHNANILKVSSVVPTDAELIEEADSDRLNSLIDPGDFYPVVISKEISSTQGEKIFAAVAGCRFESGYGVNVEIHGSDRTYEDVREEAVEMLKGMADRRDEEIQEEIIFEYNSAEVEDTCCVLSAAVYTR